MADIHGNPIRNIVAIMPGHCVSCPAREGNGGHNMYRQFFAAITSGPMERQEARNNIKAWATNMDLETVCPECYSDSKKMLAHLV